uniref:Spermatogenesis associated 7 n=3 Tax=Jaculus jaculus TaxID=51337 RepID=A0A8C5K2M5_JACJA
MEGSRRARATSVLPRYVPPCLFKGHLSTKSNAFCTDSSSLRLTTLQLVKNHMAVHYNKILSAKAAVDCSVPVSVSASIKYADQQRREKLKKELARCEKEFKLTRSAMQANSKMNSKSFYNTLQKPSGEPQGQDVFIEEVNGFSSFAKSLVPSSNGLHLSPSKSDKVLMNGTKNASSTPSSVDYTGSSSRKPCSETVCGRRPRSAFQRAHRFQLVISKAPSGDLLEKHSDLFSNKQLPFTPRTLKTEAKSFLSHYRYYTPAKRKQHLKDQRMEAETQTELSSFNSDLWTAEMKNLTDSEATIKQAPNYMTYDIEEKITSLPLQRQHSPWDEIQDGTLQHSSQSEEELLYLNFIEDVTDEILRLGLFSKRFLEQLFERHIKQNRHHLNEEKMRYLLHGLKVALGYTSEENPVKLHDVTILNFLDFQKALTSEKSKFQEESDTLIQQERQQYQKALDMLLSLPKAESEMVSPPGEFSMPMPKSKYSEGVIIQQVNDDTDPDLSAQDENDASVADSLLDQETSVDVIEGDSDTEKVETSKELCCLNMSLSPLAQCSSVRGGNNQDKELSTLKIMEMSIEDY